MYCEYQRYIFLHEIHLSIINDWLPILYSMPEPAMYVRMQYLNKDFANYSF